MVVEDVNNEFESCNTTIKKRPFNNYKHALRVHYIEEYMGKIYFNYLYQIYPEKYVFYLLSQVEELMCLLLYPIIIANNIIINNYYELDTEAINEAKTDSVLSWDNYSNYIKKNFNVYVEEFEDIYEMAPFEDKPIMKKLLLIIFLIYTKLITILKLNYFYKKIKF